MRNVGRVWSVTAVLGVALAVIGLNLVPVHAQGTPEGLYKAKCAVCHGPDGKGDTVMGKKLAVKSFQSPEVAKESDTELFDITKKGKGKMPGYDKKLTDDQIKELVKYIRSLK
ncbi:MAG TPA: cytochrome c [Candidatus Acidoferrales bacterium]|nr:cytochrome c [Candidatus Acidoferrales bacterium]